MKKILIIVSLVTLLLIGVSVFNSSDSNLPDTSSIQLAGVKPELIHEEGGKTYYVVNGNFYEKDGEVLKFVDVIYDPDFYNKNYINENGTIYQIDPENGNRYKTLRYFEDGFENANKLEDLLLGENRWHRSNVDQKNSGKADNYYNLGNRIEISNNIIKNGKNSLKSQALPSNEIVSKSSINRELMYYKNGDDVYFSGWYYFEKTSNLYDGGALTILDLESTWMRYIGIRIIIREKDALSFELEFPKTQFRQEKGREVSFPTGKWVNVKGQIHLSTENGHVKIWQDGVLVLDKAGRTLPLVNTIYNNIETGISAIAKGSKYPQTLYVDDFVISDKPIK